MSLLPSRSDLARFAALQPASRRLWIAAWLALLGADLRLRLGRRRILERAMARPREAAASSGAATAIAEQIARTVASAAAHHLWPLRCLPRALATWRLCAARGIDAQLRIGVRAGVRPGAGSIAAHAWIEVGGDAIGEPQGIEERYLPLAAAASSGPDGSADSGRA